MWLQVDKFDQRNVELLPRTIEMMSDTELTQYYIQSWSLDHRDDEANNLPGEVDNINNRSKPNLNQVPRRV